MLICLLYIKSSDDDLFVKSKHAPFIVYKFFQHYTILIQSNMLHTAVTFISFLHIYTTGWVE